VGLAARVIEEAGIPTVTLSMIPAFQGAVGAPRVAAVSHPFGRPYGDVGDAERQRAVLRAALRALETAQTPGEVVHLPFQWSEDPKSVKWGPEEPSPIIAMMFKDRRK
jgi:D-proline reductase (dithiol) PrdB